MKQYALTDKNTKLLKLYYMQDSRDWNRYIMHVFIQWLEHSCILDVWLDEVCDETGYSIEGRSGRMNGCSDLSKLMRHCFGFRQSKLGEGFWKAYADDWRDQYKQIIQHLNRIQP